MNTLAKFAVALVQGALCLLAFIPIADSPKGGLPSGVHLTPGPPSENWLVRLSDPPLGKSYWTHGATSGVRQRSVCAMCRSPGAVAS